MSSLILPASLLWGVMTAGVAFPTPRVLEELDGLHWKESMRASHKVRKVRRQQKPKRKGKKESTMEFEFNLIIEIDDDNQEIDGYKTESAIEEQLKTMIENAQEDVITANGKDFDILSWTVK